MANFYRVTAARTTSPKGFLKFNLQLNGAKWVSKLAPFKDYEKRTDKLYQFFILNGESLNSLIGKYLYIGLQSNEHGENISFVGSCDMVSDFKVLLDKHCGEPFYTSMPIYELLKTNNYAVNTDGSITLKPPYSHLDIDVELQATICYRNNLAEGHVTRKNIKLIYERFYKDFKDVNNNLDREESVFLGHVAIQKSIVRYHKNRSGVESKVDMVIVKLGDKLQPDHLIYLGQL